MSGAARSAGRVRPRKAVIRVGGVTVSESTDVASPADLKALILRAAEVSGLRRFDVKINGKVVEPGDIEKAFESSESLDVELIPADVAASWRVERIARPEELLKFR
jgi:hypothetical protein